MAGASLVSEAGEQAALPATVALAGVELPAWPDGQVVEPLSAPLMAATRFADFEAFHPLLVEAVLAAERDPCFRGKIFRGGGGIARPCPGADARASHAVAPAGVRRRQLGLRLPRRRLLHAA